MNVIPWRNKGELARGDGAGSLIDVMHEDLDRMINRFFERPFGAAWSDGGTASGGVAAFAPPVDVSETDKEVMVRAELPGVDPSRIDVKVTGDVLTLAGSKDESSEEKGRNFHRSERRFGAFTRRIQLPDYVDADKVTADYTGGVLTVHMQKKPESSSRRIKVNAK